MWDELFAVQNETKNVEDNSIVSELVNSSVGLIGFWSVILFILMIMRLLYDIRKKIMG